MAVSGVETLIDYLSAHVLLCLIPAFFLSGAFNALIPSTTIIKYMGDSSNKTRKGIAYLFAAGSGLVIEVCSCTVLPLFAGIWKKGAGFGPAIAFLFAAPGITLLSTPLTAAILGTEFAVIKLVFSIILAITLGIAMELTFKDPRTTQASTGMNMPDAEVSKRTTSQVLSFFIPLTRVMVAGTIPIDLTLKIVLVLVFSILTAFFAYKYYTRVEIDAWMHETFNFMKMIFPVLLLGVFISGAIKPLIPPELIASIAGQNTLLANLAAALFGTVAYFPTLVEVPVANMFLELGMHGGPLMSYLLVDPGISLQTLLVVNTIIKPKRTIAYALFMVLIGVTLGYLYGLVFV